MADTPGPAHGYGAPAQATAVVGTPTFPNSIKWSDDNLIAVASGHLVTILSPGSLTGPKGFIPISQSPIFDVGRVTSEEFFHPELMPFRLAREGRVCVRSIDWSPQGLASHGGCLLAVCTTDARVKLYREPFCDYMPEWVEVGDVTELMHSCCVDNKFQEADIASGAFCKRDAGSLHNLATNSNKRCVPTQEPQHRKVQRKEKMWKKALCPKIGYNEVCTDESLPLDYAWRSCITSNVLEESLAPGFICTQEVKDDTTIQGSPIGEVVLKGPMKGSSRKDVQEPPMTPAFDRCNGEGSLETQMPPQRKNRKLLPASQDKVSSPKRPDSASCPRSNTIGPLEYARRSYSVSPLVVAWSPTCHLNDRGFVFCAVGTKAGSIWLLRITVPEYYSVEIPVFPNMSLLGELVLHNSWITTVSWVACPHCDDTSEDALVLATGSSDGSVKLWSGKLKTLALLPSGSRTYPLTLLREVLVADDELVSSLGLVLPTGASSRPLLAVGKGSGQISAYEFDFSWSCTRMANQKLAHDQVVTGLVWMTDGQILYSCGQDNMMHAWEFIGSDLFDLALPEYTSLLKEETAHISIDLPASVLDPYYGVALSPGTLAMAVVRGITADMIDQMYQARAQKGVVHLFWVGCQKTKTLLDSSVEQRVESNLNKSLPLETLAIWSSRILSMLHYMKDPTRTLVLWDVTAALAALKRLSGVDFVNKVFFDWVSTWCKPTSLTATTSSFISLETLQASLPFVSCRQLQMFCVLCRRVLLVHCRPEILSQRISLEILEPTGEGLTHIGPGVGNDPHSADEDDLFKNYLWSAEHEIRQRLYLGTLTSAGRPETAEQLENRLGDMEVVTPLVVNWVLANRSKVFTSLVQLADSMSAPSDDMSLERCTFCDAAVPLDSPEIAYCQSVQSKKGRTKHKLQRCSVSLQVCPGSPLWHCSCCGRWASALAPASFFLLSSRTCLESPSCSLALQTPLPACPFCGILMHRLLPDFLLSPTLV